MSRTSAVSPSRSLTGLLPLLLILLPAALLLPGAGGFPYSRPDVAYTDMAISHYPYSLFLQRSLLSGIIPLWSPTILSGAPFAANPLSGLWYPPGWLALLFPLPLGFTLLILLHIAWGGYGLFRLLRAEGLGLPAAIFGGAAFALLPKLYAHYGAGHVTLLYAVPWTPWLFLAARHAQGKWLPVWEPVILALIFTADPRWAFYAGLAWLGYRLACTPAGAQPAALGKNFIAALLAGVLAGLLAAPLALPLLEYTRLSTRSGMAAVDQLLYSLPPERLMALLYPDFTGFHEYMSYVGQALLALALLTFLGVAALRPVRFWRWLAVVALLWSLGEAWPFASALFSLPGLDLLRVPSRSLFLWGMALCALGAHAIDALLPAALQLAPRRLKRARLALAALAALSLALVAGMAFVAGPLPVNFAWGSAFLVAAAVWILLRLSGRLNPKVWLAGMALLVAADLLAMDRSVFVMRPAAQVLSEGRPAAEYLAGKAKDGPMRVYSPSYSLPQQTAAALGLELADGIDPLKLESYAAYMETATGVPRTGYSVTLPEYINGHPEADNAAYRPDAAALGRVNVAFAVSAFPLDAPGLALEKQLDDTYIYRNELVRPRAWVQPEASLESGAMIPAQITQRGPNRIELSASGPGVLVLSEMAYPGWRAAIDGQPAELLPAVAPLSAVHVPAGEHAIVFTFHPFSVFFGLALFAVAFLFEFSVIRRQSSGVRRRLSDMSGQPSAALPFPGSDSVSSLSEPTNSGLQTPDS